MNEAASPSRRRFLCSCAASALAAALPGEAQAQAPRKPATVRERLWVWAHDAHFYNGECGLPGKSRITPVEGAVYMGVPNVMFIQYQGIPASPFEQYFVPFKAMKRVYWTLSNNGNQEHRLGAEQEHVYRLAAANPNIQGLLLDDFLVGPVKPDASKSQFPGHDAFHLLAGSPGAAKESHYATQVGLDDLAEARRRMAGLGRPIELAAVVYAHQLDPAIAPLLTPMDTVLFWTWTPPELEGLERNFRRLKQLLPGKKVLLGCYMWNFSVPPGPMPLPLLKRQCDLGLRWLKAGDIEGMIFLATNICDLDIEAVEWTRRWIAEHGDEPLKK
jgi:hypothetical protein